MTHLRIVPPADYDARPNLYDSLRPSTFERVGEALNSPRWFDRFVGFYVGVMFCCGTLILWAGVLS